jgi:hypothetical protein
MSIHQLRSVWISLRRATKAFAVSYHFLQAAAKEDARTDMTAERLLAMPLSKFNDWCADNPLYAKRLMGG